MDRGGNIVHPNIDAGQVLQQLPQIGQHHRTRLVNTRPTKCEPESGKLFISLNTTDRHGPLFRELSSVGQIARNALACRRSEPRVAAESTLIALLGVFGGHLVFDLPVDLESNGDKSATGMLAHRRR